MIPLKLSLQNFLCYRNDVPTLDLSGIHLACLCGSNGHGKSALLDAVTWALWGSARGKSQEELVHFGQDEMWVELEFLARGARYRVTRRHSRSGLRGRRGASDLQLQISANNGFHPITGNSIRETQAKIQQLIGMDYDTFINSAFLIQGRADEFTNKSPGDRKEVLAKILGLSLYDKLRDSSHSIARQKRRDADAIEAALVHMRDQMGRKDGYQQELEQVNQGLEVISSRLSAKRREIDALRLQVQTLEQKDREVQDLEARLPRIEDDIGRLHEQVQSQASRIQEYRDLLKTQSSIEEGYQRYEQVRRQYEELSSARAQFDAVSQQAADLQRAIGQAKTMLEERSRSLGQRLDRELEPSAKASVQLEERLAKARLDSEAFAKVEEALGRERERLQELAIQTGQMKTAQEQLKTEGEELRAKLDLLGRSHQDARCPLCDGSLGEEGCHRLSESYQAQINEKRQTYQRNQAALQQGLDQKGRLDRDVPRRETALRQGQQQSQQQIFALERDLEESRRAAVEAEKVTQELARLKSQLEEGLYAVEEQASLRKLEQKIGDLGYSPETHDQLYVQVQEHQDYQRKRERLKEALEKLPQEEEAISSTREMDERLRQELAQGRQRLAQMVSETEDVPSKKRDLEAADDELQWIQARHDELLGRRGSLEGNLKSIEEIHRQSAAKAGEMATLRDEQGIYDELYEAFGPKGLQALLIETILPRIEQEANKLLGRMTDGRMTVKLETQRELKSRRGEYAETLEIEISDELGPRSYEMFSGGEAFRINLALRIALSKVLAHRSGAPLPTLFIDEGFGTQDAAGRERILDVIRAIEPDFKRIIVITHLEELKEAFPLRIEVEKRDGASTCWIS